MNKELIIDCLSFDVSKDIISEAASRGGPFIVKGVVQRANAVNQNGRIYKKDLLERVAETYEREFIKERRALGELDHPESQVVNLQNVSHNVLDVAWNGDDLIGTIEVLTTPSGNILRELFKAGIKLGISSRGMGSVKKNIKESADEVQDDYSLISFDFVSNPSVRGAFLFPNGQAQLQESVVKNPITNEWEKTENIIMDILKNLN